MKVYKYKSYKAYKLAQIKANKAKIKNSWIRPETVDLICERILKATPAPRFGLCHGTRRGIEQELFVDRLNCKVLGTEISSTAKNFPRTIQWDFHYAKDEWIGACDFVYSNSLDHAYNPAGALNKWLACLTERGLLIIEWVDKLGKGEVKRSTATDPFSASTDEVCYLISESSGEVLEVVPIIYCKTDVPLDTKVSIIFARRKS